MKKSFLLFLLLIGLAVGGLAGMSLWVSKDEERVEVTQTTLLGTPSAARGLTVTARNQLDNHLFWDTRFPAQDAGQAQTQFTFSLRELSYRAYGERAPELGPPSFSGGMSTSGSFTREELSESWSGGLFAAPVADLLSEVGPNETKEVTVSLADYCQVLPVGVDLGYYRAQGEDEAWVRGQQAIQSFFDIPVPEQFQVTYTLTTNGAGEVYAIEIRAQQSQSWQSTAVRGEGGWYFVVDSHSPQEEDTLTLDLSRIRDGYGVYQIPLETQAWEDGVTQETMNPEGIHTVYRTAPGERTVDLYADNKGHLLLYTIAQETWYLNVLSGDGQQLLQRLELGRLGSDAYMADPLEGEDYLLLFFNDHQLYLLTWDGKDYTLKHTLQMPENEQWDQTGKEQLAQWDGQRLALLDGASPWDGRVYRLTVWQGGELAYQGEYTFSFTQDNLGQRYSDAMIGSVEGRAMELVQE